MNSDGLRNFFDKRLTLIRNQEPADQKASKLQQTNSIVLQTPKKDYSQLKKDSSLLNLPIDKENLKHFLPKRVYPPLTKVKSLSQNIENPDLKSVLKKINLNSMKLEVKQPKIIFAKNHYLGKLKTSVDLPRLDSLKTDIKSNELVKNTTISRRSSKNTTSTSKVATKFRVLSRKGTPQPSKPETGLPKFGMAKHGTAEGPKSQQRGPFAGVGVQTRAGRQHAVAKENQDAHAVVTRCLGRDDCGLLAVFDGHGKAGGLAAAFLAQAFPGTRVLTRAAAVGPPAARERRPAVRGGPRAGGAVGGVPAGGQGAERPAGLRHGDERVDLRLRAGGRRPALRGEPRRLGRGSANSCKWGSIARAAEHGPPAGRAGRGPPRAALRRPHRARRR